MTSPIGDIKSAWYEPIEFYHMIIINDRLIQMCALHIYTYGIYSIFAEITNQSCKNVYVKHLDYKILLFYNSFTRQGYVVEFIAF